MYSITDFSIVVRSLWGTKSITVNEHYRCLSYGVARAPMISDPLPLALKLPYRVWGQGGTVGQKLP